MYGGRQAVLLSIIVNGNFATDAVYL